MLAHPSLDAHAGAVVALAVLQAARVALAQLAPAARPARLASAVPFFATASGSAVQLAFRPATVVAGPLFEADARLALQVVNAVRRTVRQAAAEPLVGVAAVGTAPAGLAPAAALDAGAAGAALRVWAVGPLAVVTAESRLADAAAAYAAAVSRTVGQLAQVVTHGALGALPSGLAAAAPLDEAAVAAAEHGAHAVRAVQPDVPRKAVTLSQAAATVAVALARAAGRHVPGHRRLQG